MTRSETFDIPVPTTKEITMQRPPDIEAAALPSTLTVPQAAQVLGIGRTLAYELVRADAWPTPIVRAGRLIKIPTAPLLKLLATGRLPGAEVDDERRLGHAFVDYAITRRAITSTSPRSALRSAAP